MLGMAHISTLIEPGSCSPCGVTIRLLRLQRYEFYASRTTVEPEFPNNERLKRLLLFEFVCQSFSFFSSGATT